MTPEQVKSTYRRLVDQRGETVVIRRYTGAGVNRPKFEAEVNAVVTEYSPDELTGAIQQGDRRVIMLADDLAWQFALPITSSDKALVRGRECQIMAPDDSTRRVAGVLIAYELRVRG